MYTVNHAQTAVVYIMQLSTNWTRSWQMEWSTTSLFIGIGATPCSAWVCRGPRTPPQKDPLQRCSAQEDSPPPEKVSTDWVRWHPPRESLIRQESTWTSPPPKVITQKLQHLPNLVLFNSTSGQPVLYMEYLRGKEICGGRCPTAVTTG